MNNCQCDFFFLVLTILNDTAYSTSYDIVNAFILNQRKIVLKQNVCLIRFHHIYFVKIETEQSSIILIFAASIIESVLVFSANMSLFIQVFLIKLPKMVVFGVYFCKIFWFANFEKNLKTR